MTKSELIAKIEDWAKEHEVTVELRDKLNLPAMTKSELRKVWLIMLNTKHVLTRYS